MLEHLLHVTDTSICVYDTLLHLSEPIWNQLKRGQREECRRHHEDRDNALAFARDLWAGMN